MSTIPGGGEPREDLPIPEEPTPAVPEPSTEDVPPSAPEPPAAPEPVPAEPAPGGASFPPPDAFAPSPDAYPPPASSYPPPDAYPPPAGAYPPPGYQAPPAYEAPPSYQAPPAGYGQPAAGYAQGYAQPSLFGVALSDGWKSFQRVGGTFVGAMVVWAIGGSIVLGIVSAIFGGFGKLAGSNGTAMRGLTGATFSVATFVLGIVSAIIVALIQAQFVRVALTVTRGHRPAFGEFFRFEDAGPVVVLALIIGVVEGVLGGIPFLGWLFTLAIGFFLLFAYYVLLDRRVQPVEAIRGSVELVRRNIAQTLVFAVLAFVIIIVGLILCLVGVFVAAPVVLLATAYLYRRLTGEQPQLPV